MDERDLNSFFEKKLNEINQRTEIDQLRKELKDFKELQEKEFKELKEATTDICPKCHKLVNSAAKHCTTENCDAEFE